jgi:uncharacterized damage-inducible protein DinB
LEDFFGIHDHAPELLAFQKHQYLHFTSIAESLPDMNSTVATTLAPPGAGLPAPELWIARVLFGLKRCLGTREGFTARFEQERIAIREMLATCDVARHGEQVLIPRLRGLEDSSRHWSIWMTLEHLRITNSIFAMVITSLAHGKVPTKKASTADVKPRADVTAEVEQAFETSCDEILAAAAAVSDLKTAARYAHPWFGPLDAAGWHALAATHMAIHRAQIAKIIAALPSKPAT